MSKQFMRIKSGINLGNMTADPVDGANGDMYYNTASSTIREFVAGQWRDAVEANNTQVLFNKTLNNLQTNASVDNSSTGSTATLLPSNTGALYVVNAGLTGVSGITPNGAGGQILIVENKSGNGVIIHNDDVAAIAGRRIFTGTGNDVLWGNNATYIFIYDAVNSHWMLTGASAGGGGGGLTSLVVGTNTNMLDNYSYIVSPAVVRSTFNYPQDVAIDSSTGNMYVVDTNNHVIRMITSGGVVSIFAGTIGISGAIDGTGAGAYFYGPQGIAFDSVSGNLYVADTYNSTIRKITTPGAVVTTLAGTALSPGAVDATGAAARFNLPQGIVTDSTGNIFVADTFNCGIRKVTPAGVVTTFAGSLGGYGSGDGTGTSSSFWWPQGITIDGSDNLYVADTQNQIIRKITSAAVVTTLAGTAGVIGNTNGTGAAAQFNYPQGIGSDSAGNLYVADTYNSTIRAITPAGVVTTFAGTPLANGTADGTGTSARFNNPNDVVVDSSGNLWVADTNNNTIRKITSGAVVTTFAGNAPPYGTTTIMTLPSTSSVGDRLEIIGNSSYGWAIIANASTCTINDNGTSLSAFAGNELMASSGAFNTVGLVCTTANTGWTVVYKNGPLLNSNYYGTGADGSVTISANTNLVPPVIYSPYDGDAIVMNYANLTINSGVTLTASQPCRGMILYVNGDLTVNGTISMTARGAYVNPVAPMFGPATPQDGVVIRRFKAGSSGTNLNVDRFIGMGARAQIAENNQPPVINGGFVLTIPIVGGQGGLGGGGVGQNGGTLLNAFGGGGGGGSGANSGANGNSATCYSGGTGGGGSAQHGAAITVLQDGQPYGGQGGRGIGYNPDAYGGAGAGNPGGTFGAGGGNVPSGADGTGGLLMIFVKGNVIIGATGSIQANGASGQSGESAGGGGSGGGAVVLWRGGTYSNSGTVQANGGGPGFFGGSSPGANGGSGGAGTVSVVQIN